MKLYRIAEGCVSFHHYTMTKNDIFRIIDPGTQPLRYRIIQIINLRTKEICNALSYDLEELSFVDIWEMKRTDKLPT